MFLINKMIQYIILLIILVGLIYLYKRKYPLNFSIKNLNPNQKATISIYINDSLVQKTDINPQQTIQINTKNSINQRTQKPFERNEIKQIIIQTTENTNSQIALQLNFGNLPKSQVGMYQDINMYKPISMPQDKLNEGYIVGQGFYGIKFINGIPLL